MFANGELRWHVQTVKRKATEASSGYFFLFAEFALTAIESDIDKSAWESLAPVMVRCQKIVERVYQLDGFGHARFKGKPTMFTKAEKNELAKQFRKTHHYLCTAHAKNADAACLGKPRERPGPLGGSGLASAEQD